VIGIIDLGLGNIGSIQNMFAKVGIVATAVNTDGAIRRSEKLILPGVGAFSHGMSSLNDSGLRHVLEEKVLGDRTPVLGICLGMQMLARHSEEGDVDGLGWIAGRTVRLRGETPATRLRVPHMGWNQVKVRKASTLFDGVSEDARFYFVHSYHVVCDDPEDVLATVQYGAQLTAAVARGNVMGTQFHPEKSHKFGMAVLKNFALAC
jgi:imidazole glycerol-phosphate synthase subunit HisH